MVQTNSVVLGSNVFLEVVDIVVDFADEAFEGLESHEQLSLDLDALFVVVLVPDLVIVVEIPNLVIEVASGKFLTTVLDVVVGVLVAGVAVVVVASRVGLTGDVGVINGSCRSINLGLRRDFGALDECDRGEKGSSEFHLIKYILKFC